MKKIIVVFDGIHYSKGAFNFARELNELSPVFITAVFVPQTIVLTGDDAPDGYIPILEGTPTDIIESNIAEFEKNCKNHKIDYSVHRDFNDFAIPELVKESLFADLLLVGSELFFFSAGIEKPNIYLKTLLHNSKCPVIAVPEKFVFPREVMIAFSDGEDSIFALKQFAYILPELTKLRTSIVSIGKRREGDFSYHKQLEEYAATHFTNYTIESINLDKENFPDGFFSPAEPALLVCGSYGRPLFSHLFKKSFADSAISSHSLPVFISHL